MPTSSLGSLQERNNSAMPSKHEAESWNKGVSISTSHKQLNRVSHKAINIKHHDPSLPFRPIPLLKRPLAAGKPQTCAASPCPTRTSNKPASTQSLVITACFHHHTTSKKKLTTPYSPQPPHSQPSFPSAASISDPPRYHPHRHHTNTAHPQDSTECRPDPYTAPLPRRHSAPQ